MSNVVTQWAIKSLPNFQGMKAYILPGAFYGQVVGLFAKAGFERADSVAEADVVVFIGGVDVDPRLYGQQIIFETQTPSISRDNAECVAFLEARAKNIPCIGICRGAQFLHVVNGGSLWQDVNNHAGPDHLILDIGDNCTVKATSLHHQMLQPHEDMEILATTVKTVATKFKDDRQEIEGRQWAGEPEIEAGVWYKSKCFFVQGHPEIGSPEYRSWFMYKVHEMLEVFDEMDENEEYEIAVTAGALL